MNVFLQMAHRSVGSSAGAEPFLITNLYPKNAIASIMRRKATASTVIAIDYNLMLTETPSRSGTMIVNSDLEE